MILFKVRISASISNIFLQHNSFMFVSAAGDLPDGVHNDKNPVILGLGLDPIKTRPNFCQILKAMLRLRLLRLFRNIQLLYFTIVAPLALVALGLYINSIQTVDIKMQSLQLKPGERHAPALSLECLSGKKPFTARPKILTSLIFHRHIWFRYENLLYEQHR